MKHVHTLCLLLAATLAAPTFGQVIEQAEVGPNTCGPCAIVHSFFFADNRQALEALQGETNTQKASWFCETFGTIDSVAFNGTRPAYLVKDGIADVDLHAMLDRFIADAQCDPVTGGPIRLNPDIEEQQRDFVARVHRQIRESIDAGFHPLLSIRALAAQYSEERERPLWNSKGGHWIAIHGVEPLGDEGLGFLIHFSDSLSGERQTGYVMFNDHRRAVVPLTFTVDEEGNEVWDWVTNSQTLELVAPGMPLGTVRAEWHERTFIALRYLIYRRPVTEE